MRFIKVHCSTSPKFIKKKFVALWHLTLEIVSINFFIYYSINSFITMFHIVLATKNIAQKFFVIKNDKIFGMKSKKKYFWKHKKLNPGSEKHLRQLLTTDSLTTFKMQYRNDWEWDFWMKFKKPKFWCGVTKGL